MRFNWRIVLASAVLLPMSAQATLTDVIFQGSGTSPVGGHGALSAQVEFILSLNANSSLNTIKVILTNTVTPHVYEPADLLSAVLFQFDNATTLTNTNQHVFLSAGSHLTNSVIPSNVDIGYQFAVVSGTPFGLTGNAFGFSSTGIGTFSQSNFKDNSGVSLGGSDYNLTHAGMPLHGSPGSPLVDNSLWFKVNAANVMDLSHLDKVAFQFGTAIEDGHIGGHKVFTPEPVTSSLVLGSAIAFYRRRRAQSKA